ncbi:3-deoxy-7-phosphoheptulonate synthase [Actinoallomurus sp. NPDC052308]|uniref:3-deoxy-7-phosphoheptulonate synthase n=1 Tax=Actinoallomurus sp. NPDC052308 TaxID=3155530 RepID=UPI00342C1EA9
MIIELVDHADHEDAEQLAALLRSRGGSPHIVRWPGRWLILETAQDIDETWLRQLPIVARVVGSTDPHPLSGRKFQSVSTMIEVGGRWIGDGTFLVIAGPCAVESREQLAATAAVVTSAKASMLRGGAFKPRTSPYSFQGLGVRGLELLAEERLRSGLPVVTEAIQPKDVETVAEYADVVQVGARNMQNYALLGEVGRCGRPVLLKRGLAATIQEWLLAAEYVMNAGNPQVMLCERGIRTFETASRFTLDLAAVPIVKRLSHLPIIVDPSHSAGRAFMVPSLTLAAAAAGADGVIVDVHNDPASALCDADQALSSEEFKSTMVDLERVLAVLGRHVA